VTLDRLFSDTAVVPIISFGPNACQNPVSLDESTFTYSCILSEPLIGGKYKVSVSTQLGSLNSISDSLANFPITITSVIPATVSSFGGDLISIKGTCFPSNNAEGLIIKTGNAQCLIKSVNNTEIQCVVGKKINEDPLTLSYKEVSTTVDSSLFQYDDVNTSPPVILSITPASISPGEKKTLRILFDRDITSYSSGLSNISAKLIHKTKANYEIRMNPLEINTDTLSVRYGGAQMGEYLVYLKLDENTSANNDINFIVTFEITDISIKEGSLNGGTFITISGNNFLSTQLNQVVYIGNTPCNYVSNTESSIECITSPPKSTTPTELFVEIVIEQMIQFASICKIDSGQGCVFKYTNEKTSHLNSVLSKNSDSVFLLDYEIEINGSNFNFKNDPTILKFSWGEITVVSFSDSKITGTISKIDKYGIFKFEFKDDYGLAIHEPLITNSEQADNSILIFIKKTPIIINSISTSSIGEFGAIFKFYTASEDFLEYKNTSGTLLNEVSICGINCKVLEKNLLSDDLNNFQCIIDTQTSTSTFNDCEINLKYYLDTISIPTSSISVSASSANNIEIEKIMIDDIDVTDSNFTINDSSKFVLKIVLNSSNTSFTDLKLIWESKQKLDASSDVVADGSDKVIYKFELTNGLPAGITSCAVLSESMGFLKPPATLSVLNSFAKNTSYFKLKINAKLDEYTSSTSINSSFFGGVSVTLKGKNLNRSITSGSELPTISSHSFQKIYVCDILAKVEEFSSSHIQFLTPPILNYDLFFNKKILTENHSNILNDETYSNIVEDSISPAVTNKSILYDNNPFTSLKTTTSTLIGIKIKSSANPKFKILLKKISIIIGQTAKPDDFANAYVEGSNDGSNWIKLSDLPTNLLPQWTSIHLYKNEDNAPFSHIRLATKATSSIAEIRFYGNVVYQTTEKSETCNIRILDDFNNITIQNLNVLYDIDKTYFIKSITPEFGPSVGGTAVTFNLHDTNTLDVSDTVSIKIFGQSIISPININTNSLESTIIKRDDTLYDSTSPLVIKINSIGHVYCDIHFRYQDRWSDSETWGGEFIPIDGETAYIKNTDVILDVANVNLNTLIIENGSLTVEDNQDYNLTARVILVKSGKFEIGKEDTPFQNKFILTLKSNRSDPSIPIFGNKVLAILEGQLEIHGKPKTPNFTFLTKTHNSGLSVITVRGPVSNWQVGDEIVIASSNTTPYESELRKIIAISNSDSDEVSITLNQSLKYTHYGVIEKYGENDEIDMRAEVANLTRNIVIQGDETSAESQYGAHVMLTAMKMDMNTESSIETSGKISYVEVRRAGQAFQLGRYPIHFHMIGDVSGSYVKGCSIHDTYNRALTIHAVNNFLVESNVAYNTMGHTFFIEDAVEINNTIKNNIGILTRKSTSLLNADMHPATFWITNPNNFVEGNHAVGSEFYGFWMDIPESYTGLNRNIKGCPRDLPLGSFKDNVSHSNLHYGIRIFPKFTPKSKTCANIDGTIVTSVKAVFQNLTSYANGKKGLVTEIIGNVIFENIKSADNSQSGLEVSQLDSFPEGMAGFKNCVIIGKSQNPVVMKNNFNTSGIVTPRNDKFMVEDIRFYSFDGLKLFASCSRCEVSPASTDSGGRTIFFRQIKSDDTESKKVYWTIPRPAIFRDLDGTLTGSSGPAWVSPYFVHNEVPQCKRDEKWDDGLICDNSVQVRRLAFSESQPSNIFAGQPLRILRLIDKLENIDKSLLDDFNSFSEIKFKEDKDPSNGWVAPFVTGYNYLLSFGRLGIDFDSLAFERSFIWEENDSPINLVFNYTLRRDEFNIFGTDNVGNSYKITNTTDLNTINKGYSTQNNDVEYGKFFNDIEGSKLYVRVNAYNPNKLKNLKLKIVATQCYNNDCGKPPEPPVIPPEDKERKWSDTSNWPNNELPAEGQEVEIKSEWTMILDVSTPKLAKITINGVLVWDKTKNNIELKADNILNYGKLVIGKIDEPFTNKAKISLSGIKFSPNIALSNDLRLTNNALVNIGEINIFGQDRGPYVSRLLISVLKGDSKMVIAKNLKWLKDDKIVLTTTTHDPSQTEFLTVISYDELTGELIFSPSLKYNHFGSTVPTLISDNPLNPKINLDERAEVYMLTRNIEISGSQSSWSCNIMTTTFASDNYVYYGKTNILHTQIRNCGQTDTGFSALQFLNKTNKENSDYLEGLSFYDNPYNGIKVDNSNNIIFKNIILYNNKQYGIHVVSSDRIKLENVSVVYLMKREVTPAINVNNFIDTNSCFSICIEGRTCSDIELINTTCAGSEFFGYIIDSFDCVINLEANNNYQFAYATAFGFLMMNRKNRSCMKAGNVVSYNNKAGYVSFVPSLLTIHENIISSNNMLGVVILNGSSTPNSRNILRRALILGQNKENPICLDTRLCEKGESCERQIGFLLALTAESGGASIPIDKMNFPMWKPMADSAYGSFFDGYDVSFVNFEDQCEYPQFVFNSNPFDSDMSSIHNFRQVVLSRVLEENIVYFELPKNSWIGDPCGNFPCTGPNNILLTFSSFASSKEEFKDDDIIINSKWNGALKKYVRTNESRPKLNYVDGIELIPSYQVKNMKFCENLTNGNALLCQPTRKLGKLLFEHLDAEAETRNLTPIKITSQDPSDAFENVINTFQDHGCEFGYPNFTRTPRFPSIIQLDRNYVIQFTSTNPEKVKFHLLDSSWDNKMFTFDQYISSTENNTISGVGIKIQYSSPKTVLVYDLKTNTEIKSKQYKEGEVFNETTCGASKWTPVQNTLEFYITNSPNCEIFLNSVNSIQLSLRLNLTVEEFYSKDSANSLVYNIAAVLGIPPEQIRITGVRKGSAIIEMQILETIPTVDKTNDGQVVINTDTPKLKLNDALSTIVDQVKSGAIELPAPVLSISAKISIVEATEENPKPDDSNNQDNKEDDVVIIITPDNEDDKKEDEEETYPISIKKNESYIKYMLIIIFVGLGLILIGFGIYLYVSKVAKKNKIHMNTKCEIKEGNLYQKEVNKVEIIPFNRDALETPTRKDNIISERGILQV